MKSKLYSVNEKKWNEMNRRKDIQINKPNMHKKSGVEHEN